MSMNDLIIFMFSIVLSFSVQAYFQEPKVPQKKGYESLKVFNKSMTLQHQMSTQIELPFSLSIISSPDINASASIDDVGNPVVQITEAMFHHPKMNPNAIMLLICHELGHVFGGVPKQMRGRSSQRSWSTAEGQADYYSILFCAKKLKLEPTSEKYDFCTDDIQCHALVKAAIDLAQIYAEIKFWPYPLDINAPDLSVVRETELLHPSPQCRLDTFIAAIKCLKPKVFNQETLNLLTCENHLYRQPSCWMSPNTFQDI